MVHSLFLIYLSISTHFGRLCPRHQQKHLTALTCVARQPKLRNTFLKTDQQQQKPPARMQQQQLPTPRCRLTLTLTAATGTDAATNTHV